MKEWKLDINEFMPKFISICNEFKVNPREVRFYAQQDEDKYILQKMLKKKIDDGVFLELGACDGLLYSNTKVLEDHFGFNGILIEPIPHFYELLVKNRPNCTKYNLAISDSDDEEVTFCGMDAEGGIKTHLNKESLKTRQTYTVKNSKLSDVIEKTNYNYIDLMIIDVEGAELQVLKSIDFSLSHFNTLLFLQNG